LSVAEVMSDTDIARRLYGQSIEYSLQALISWVVNLQDEDLVLVLLGDHQPATLVSGPDASHKVPISLVASDPAVLDRTDAWNWQEGLLPSPTAPVWRMDASRERFLDVFSTTPGPQALRPPR
jgi:hypothetical protein